MKTLLIVRHGKSSWKDATLSDAQRPLKKRGVKQSKFIGSVLLDAELIPQLILSSPAERTRQTAEIIAGTSLVSNPMEIVESFYLAEPEAYIDALAALPDTIERVMVVGHNPGLEALIQLFDGKAESLQTGSLAYIVLNLKEWSALTKNTPGDLIGYWNMVLEEPQAKGKEKKHHKDDKEKVKTRREGKTGEGELAMKKDKDKKGKKGKKDKKNKKDKNQKKNKKNKKGKKNKK